MKTHSSNFTFQDILRHLAKRTPEENLRNAFNLWQFAKDLQDQNTKNRYDKRKLHTTRTIA